MADPTPVIYQRLRAMPKDLADAVRKEVYNLLAEEPRQEFAKIADLVNRSFSTSTAKVEIGYDIVRTLN